MKYNGVVISDIHFGVIDSQELKKELSDVFIKYITGLKSLDFIIITGDYFDHKIYLNDRTSDYAFSFMNLLVEISKRFKCPIRCIYGTESHEVNQYNIFSVFENDTEIDFKVIYTAQEEELRKGLNVLYLPEEFVYSKKEYYKEFFDKKNKYDYVFGHGVIQEVMTDAVRHTKDKSERKKVPYFTTSELINVCKGQVYFGHYHVNTNIADKIFYVGSYTRWMHGEEEPKGFYHLKCNTEKESYKEDFIENCLAKKYKDFIYGYSDKIMQSEDELLKELSRIDKLLEIKDIDYAKFTFNIPENHPNPEFIINLLNERYKFNDYVNLKIVNGYVEKKKKINKEKLNDVMNEFPMIFDKSAKLENKIIYYIKKKKDRDIPEENVKMYLYGSEEVES